MPKNEVRIYNSKAVIYQNDYDVWQFRIWLADEDKYFRQSLRTKDKAKAIADAEEMYEDIKYMKRRGKKIYSISIKQAVAMYIEDKAKYVGIDGANGIVEGRLGTIKAHMKHFLEYVHKDAKVKDLGTKSKAKKVKNFPSITPPPTPKSKNLPTSNAVSSTSTSANDIQNVRNDFMAKQQASQPIKPQGTVGTL